jgi:hypothetical protein
MENNYSSATVQLTTPGLDLPDWHWDWNVTDT